MLSSRYLITILVTIVSIITYKPCKSINSLNHLNQIKTSFLQKAINDQDTPESVTSGETVDVVSNKDVGSTVGGNGKDSEVKSKTTSEEVKKHDQDESVGDSTPNEEESAKEKSKTSDSGVSEDKKEAADNVESKGEVKPSSSEEVEEKGSAHEENGHSTEKSDNEEGDPTHHDEEHVDEHDHAEDHSESNTETGKEESKKEEEPKESGDSQKEVESPETSNEPVVIVDHKVSEPETHKDTPHEGKAGTAKVEAEDHIEVAEPVHKSEDVEKHVSPEAREVDVGPGPHTNESREPLVEHTETHGDLGTKIEEHHSVGVQHKHEETDHEEAEKPHKHAPSGGVDHANQPTHVAEATYPPVTPAPQPSTNTQSDVAAHVPAPPESHVEPESVGTSVQHQSETTPSPAPEPKAPSAVDLHSLTDDEKKKVIDFWSKPGSDCSLDCSHSCKSELGGATQCVSVTGSALSCSAFSDTDTLACPNGYTPCTQPNVTTLKSYTLKNGDMDVGALEVDGSNFNKCMGLALTTPNGKCDKENLAANLLFTAGALNLDYEINVAADKLTFSNLKMKNGNYRVCVFQRHEGNLEGMTLATLWKKLMDFVNPTSSTPSETKTVFSIDVGTLNVSD